VASYGVLSRVAEGIHVEMNPAYISALAALAGSAIGALASFGTTWLSQIHQDHVQQLDREATRRERLFAEFIDQASRTFVDAMVQDRLDDPTKLVPMYASMSKLRLFATPRTIAAAEAVLESVLKTYEAPPALPEAAKMDGLAAHDILRAFAESCRAELTALR
jgi:hypothetical protein